MLSQMGLKDKEKKVVEDRRTEILEAFLKGGRETG
jgi:hypothetical protein